MPDIIREYGRGARMLAYRKFFGLDRKQFAAILNVRLSTLQRWENGQDNIRSDVWDTLARIHEKFEADVAGVLSLAEESDADRVRVRVWRSDTSQHQFPEWWQRVVSEAMIREPRIEPVFPEDDKDD